MSASRSRAAPRTVGKALAAVASALVLVVAGVSALVYEQLNGNIKGVPIFGGGTEKPDAFGRTPINILVIGSDTRSTPEDCRLGGDCGSGPGNADVEMIVHVAADRSNATVMSVPRDTLTALPTCKAPGTGGAVPAGPTIINSALAYGPGCQVAAVHELTGIPIDHFVMVDFSGVVNMSDAIGGVPVCVSNNVYDTYSHLKLSRGTHTLKGVSTLEFLRTRHGFGDGSDLGRTVAQHVYLASMIRTLKSAGTLTEPAALYGLADAATKAVTVDKGLASIPSLLGLATDMNKVPAGRVTFTTMQTVPDPRDSSRVLVAPAARKLFDAIIYDRSLSGPGSGRSRADAHDAQGHTTTRPSGPAGGAGDAGDGGDGGGTSASAAAAITGSRAQNGSARACAQVSALDTVAVHGVPMTPAHAYADSPGVPNSAP